MAVAAARVTYHTTVREMPSDERPRERLAHYGPQALSNAEVLAILLRVGSVGENVVELSARLLRQRDGLAGLLTIELEDLCALRGVGPAKATTLKAALELGRRISVLVPEERPKITQPQDVANLIMLEMGYLKQEQLRVLCLDTKNNVVM